MKRSYERIAIHLTVEVSGGRARRVLSACQAVSPRTLLCWQWKFLWLWIHTNASHLLDSVPSTVYIYIYCCPDFFFHSQWLCVNFFFISSMSLVRKTSVNSFDWSHFFLEHHSWVFQYFLSLFNFCP